MKKIFTIVLSLMLMSPVVSDTVDVPETNVSAEIVADKLIDVKQAEVEQTEPKETIVNIGVCKLTAYCRENYPHICNNGNSNSTATGTVPTPGRTIAVDPSVIPYGSKVLINGQTYIAEDCGGSIKGNRIDILFDTHQDALNFGIQYAEVACIIKEDKQMCYVCRQSPCDSRCPNAEFKVLYTCEICGEDICEGDAMYVIDDTHYCEDCIIDCKRYAEPEEF